MECHLERVEGADVLDDAVARQILFQLLDKGTEHAIPDDQRSSIVGIEIAWIGGVVDAVMRGRVEDEFEPAPHPADRLGVDPELINEVEAVDEGDQRRMEAEQHHRHLQHEHAGEQAGPALPERRREIVVLAGMVVDVLRPHPAAAMGDAMVHVIAQVIDQEGRDTGPYRHPEVKEAELPNPQQRRVGDDAEQNAGGDVTGAHHQAGQRIACLERPLGAAGAHQP